MPPRLLAEPRWMDASFLGEQEKKVHLPFAATSMFCACGACSARVRELELHKTFPLPPKSKVGLKVKHCKNYTKLPTSLYASTIHSSILLTHIKISYDIISFNINMLT